MNGHLRMSVQQNNGHMATIAILQNSYLMW